MEKIIGEITPFPGASANDVLQKYDDTCAIKSQQIILESFGHHVSEDQLVQEALSLGIYSPHAGTEANDVGRLLEEHGVDVHSMFGANTYDIVYELSQGHKVIVGVDENELLRPSLWQSLKDHFDCQPNHALVVTGIDTTYSDNVQVIVCDPGTGQVAARYPMASFIDAWSDSCCFMVATNDAPPMEYDPNMINFDYASGHIPMVGPYQYAYFLSMDPASLHRDFKDKVYLDMLGTAGGESAGSMAARLSTEDTCNSVETDDFDWDSGNIFPLDGPGW